MRQRTLMVLAPVLVLVSCVNRKTETSEFEKLSRDFVYGSLALSPVSGTSTGYHQDNGRVLDELLDDYSPAGMDAQRRFAQGIQTRLASLNTASLDKEQQADLEIIKNNLALSFLELDTIQSYKHNPTIYVELVGNALFTPFVLNYAPADRRFQHITKRLEKVPDLMSQARANLMDAPEVWNRVAREENQGNIDLIDKTLREAAPEAQKADYGLSGDKACT